MSVAHWNSSESISNDWDTLKLNGQLVPGIVRVEVNLPVELDIKKGKGLRKARIGDEGEEPAKITISILVWTTEQTDQLAAIVPLLVPRGAKGGREPLTIEHPNAGFWNISRIIVGSIRSPMPDAVGAWTLEIDAREWVPEPKKVTQKTVKKDDAKTWQDFRNQVLGKRRTDPDYLRANRPRGIEEGAVPPSAGAVEENVF